MILRTEKNCWQQDIKKKDYIKGVTKVTGLVLLMAWLYYRSLWAVVGLTPVWIWYYRMWERECTRQKSREFQLQFKDTIQALSSALNIGYSVENAWKETKKEVELLYDKDKRIIKELHILVTQLRINIPMEQILEELAVRVDCEDVRNFTAVFGIAKRSGGDMIAIIRNAVNQIGDKIDVRREIDTILAAKKYEFKVMSMIPYLIIGYMSVSFPEFMKVLYGNILGIGVMSICLLAYIGAYHLGLKIIEIEV